MLKDASHKMAEQKAFVVGSFTETTIELERAIRTNYFGTMECDGTHINWGVLHGETDDLSKVSNVGRTSQHPLFLSPIVVVEITYCILGLTGWYQREQGRP